jgi:predicted nucleotidyltransferase
MYSMPEPLQHSIAELCRRYGVRRLDLFGSAAGEDFDASNSDLDFMVEFTDGGPKGAADRYFGLQDELQQVLGRPVDLVMRAAIRNPYFLKAAQSRQINLYAA